MYVCVCLFLFHMSPFTALSTSITLSLSPLSADTKYRDRNVAKLLFIHMLGYPTHFGHMECINLCASPKFADKRIGYLALMLMVDESQKELMLVTHSLQRDFGSRNPYVAGLALCTVGNVASADMARQFPFFLFSTDFEFQTSLKAFYPFILPSIRPYVIPSSILRFNSFIHPSIRFSSLFMHFTFSA